jgi:hypothetical protein
VASPELTNGNLLLTIALRQDSPDVKSEDFRLTIEKSKINCAYFNSTICVNRTRAPAVGL